MVKSGVELLLKPSGVTLAQSTNGRVLVCNNHAEIAGLQLPSPFFPFFSLRLFFVKHYTNKDLMFSLF